MTQQRLRNGHVMLTGEVQEAHPDLHKVLVQVGGVGAGLLQGVLQVKGEELLGAESADRVHAAVRHRGAVGGVPGNQLHSHVHCINTRAKVDFSVRAFHQ